MSENKSASDIIYKIYHKPSKKYVKNCSNGVSTKCVEFGTKVHKFWKKENSAKLYYDTILKKNCHVRGYNIEDFEIHKIRLIVEVII